MGTQATIDLLKRVSALPQSEGFAPNGEVFIHYRTYGSGAPLLFQHGFPDTEETFFNQVLEFARDHQVITPTLRGYPPSTEPANAEDYVIPELASDIGAVLDHLGIAQAILAGHDWGGIVLQAFALFHPERVKGLIFMNTPVLQPFINTVNSDAEQQRLSEYTIPYINYERNHDKNIEHVVRDIRDVVWRERIATYLSESSMYGMLSYYKVAYPGPPYGAAAPEEQTQFVYKVPSLVLWGLEDHYSALSHLNNLWDWFSQSYRFVTIPGAGHWVHQDAPGSVNAEIRSWLDMRGW